MSQTEAQQSEVAFTAPLEAPLQRVLPEWIDFNGHMNIAYYSMVFDKALDWFSDLLGCGWDYTKLGQGSLFALESHIVYAREVKEGDPLRVTFQLLDHDQKRMHYIEQLYHAEEGYLAATSEQMSMHVDLTTRRSSPWPADVQDALARLRVTHAGMPRPPQVGRLIGIPPK
jgi:acyl-CoA thioester hydrolase